MWSNDWLPGFDEWADVPWLACIELTLRSWKLITYHTNLVGWALLGVRAVGNCARGLCSEQTVKQLSQECSNAHWLQLVAFRYAVWR